MDTQMYSYSDTEIHVDLSYRYMGTWLKKYIDTNIYDTCGQG